MNGLTTIAQLPRSGGAGMEMKAETNRRPAAKVDCGVTYFAPWSLIQWFSIESDAMQTMKRIFKDGELVWERGE